MAYLGFPTFPCAVATCDKRVGVKGNKCRKCKDSAMFGVRKEPLTPEQQADRYVAGKTIVRTLSPRRAKH